MNPHPPEESSLHAHAQIKLALLGFTAAYASRSAEWLKLAEPLIARQRQTARLLSNYLNPTDQRIQSFLFDYFQELETPRLPTGTLVLDRLRQAWANLNRVAGPDYAVTLVGTIGVQRVPSSHPPDAGKK